MRSHEEIFITLAITSMQAVGVVKPEQTLEERLRACMAYVRDKKNHANLFYMAPEVTNELMFRTGLAAIMVSANEEDKEEIKRSIKPLQMLNAATSGVPVDWSAVLEDDRPVLPLMKIFHEAGEQPAISA